MKKEILSCLIVEHVKVMWEGKVGNYTQFVSYKMTFWLVLPSWLLKVPNMTRADGDLFVPTVLRSILIIIFKEVSPA